VLPNQGRIVCQGEIHLDVARAVLLAYKGALLLDEMPEFNRKTPI